MGTRRRRVLVLVAFAVSFFVAQQPALTSAWWFLDDYARILADESPFVRACQNGRPLEALWLCTLHLDRGLGHEAANILLRFVQACAFVLAVYLGSEWLAERSGRRSLVWIGLIPLLWPFHTEAILWRTAGSYALAYLMAVIALRLALPAAARASTFARTLGAMLLMASVLMNQTASLVFWLLPLIHPTLTRRCREWLFFVPFYVTAVALSFGITQLEDFATARGALATSPWDKAGVLREAVSHTFCWKRLYPAILCVAQLTLLGTFLSCLPWKDLRQLKGRIAHMLLLTCVAFASILAVKENAAPFRVLLLGPWLIVACVVAVHVGDGSRRTRARLVCGLATLAVIAAHVLIGRRNAAEYVQLFEQEQEVVRVAQDLAIAHGTNRCRLERPDPSSAETNPFGMVYTHELAKISALQNDWSAPGRISRFSELDFAWLKPVGAPPELQSKALRYGFVIGFDARSGSVVILQPRRQPGR